MLAGITSRRAWRYASIARYLFRNRFGQVERRVNSLGRVRSPVQLHMAAVGLSSLKLETRRRTDASGQWRGPLAVAKLA
jgi:hypothetical protein